MHEEREWLNELVTTGAAAGLLGVGASTVRRLIDDGQLEAHRVRSAIRITRASVARYLDEQRAIPVFDRELQAQAAERRRAEYAERQSGGAIEPPIRED